MRLKQDGDTINLMDTTKWQDTLKEFVDKLSNEGGLHSVKDLYRFLQDEPEFKDKSHVLDYLVDYRHVSNTHLQFHQKWAHLSNMKNVAEYELREIALIDELIAALQAE